MNNQEKKKYDTENQPWEFQQLKKKNWLIPYDMDHIHNKTLKINSCRIILCDNTNMNESNGIMNPATTNKSKAL